MVGFAFHTPGLWLFFRRTVPVAARRENLAAVLVALLSMAATAWFSGNWIWVAIVWLVGHVSWGARLAWYLSQDAEDGIRPELNPGQSAGGHAAPDQAEDEHVIVLSEAERIPGPRSGRSLPERPR
jgi:hypothetical protein